MKERNPYRKVPWLARILGKRMSIVDKGADGAGQTVHYIGWKGKTYITHLVVHPKRPIL